jgi:hypothetical protein
MRLAPDQCMRGEETSEESQLANVTMNEMHPVMVVLALSIQAGCLCCLTAVLCHNVT